MNAVDKCRQMGLKVGDKIIGSESYADYLWETELTLLFLGTEIVVWSERHRETATSWGDPKESAAWSLDYREWKKVDPEAGELAQHEA